MDKSPLFDVPTIVDLPIMDRVASAGGDVKMSLPLFPLWIILNSYNNICVYIFL